MTINDPLISRAEAVAKGEDGIKRSAEHSGEAWLDIAKAFLHEYCKNNSSIFCDEVWEAGLPRPESPRAFGAVIKYAIKNEWMVATGQSRPSVQSNMGLRMVYTSLLNESQEATREKRIKELEMKIAAYDAMCEVGLIQFDPAQENPCYSVWGFTCWHHDQDILKAIAAANEPVRNKL